MSEKTDDQNAEEWSDISTLPLGERVCVRDADGRIEKVTAFKEGDGTVLLEGPWHFLIRASWYLSWRPLVAHIPSSEQATS